MFLQLDPVGGEDITSMKLEDTKDFIKNILMVKNDSRIP